MATSETILDASDIRGRATSELRKIRMRAVAELTYPGVKPTRRTALIRLLAAIDEEISERTDFCRN